MAIHEVHFKCHNIELSPSPNFFWWLLYLPMRLGLIWWLIFCLNCVLQKVWEDGLKFHRSIWIRFGSSLFFSFFLQRNQCWSKKKVVSLCCSSSFFIAMLLSSGELKEVVFPCCSSFQSSISNIKKIVNVPMKKRELHVDLYFIAMLLSSGELKKVVFPCCSSFQSSIVILRK